jgi:hypothetical protein
MLVCRYNALLVLLPAPIICPLPALAFWSLVNLRMPLWTAAIRALAFFAIFVAQNVPCLPSWIKVMQIASPAGRDA